MSNSGCFSCCCLRSTSLRSSCTRLCTGCASTRRTQRASTLEKAVGDMGPSGSDTMDGWQPTSQLYTPASTRRPSGRGQASGPPGSTMHRLVPGCVASAHTCEPCIWKLGPRKVRRSWRSASGADMSRAGMALRLEPTWLPARERGCKHVSFTVKRGPPLLQAAPQWTFREGKMGRGNVPFPATAPRWATIPTQRLGGLAYAARSRRYQPRLAKRSLW
ncbi:hypothetical protein FOCC_FOCC003880 [Frankliniella occidentalis]|nr:hypothetical protein FOCC_FOCC003880 [Frankliniella occidentalis]